MNKAIVLIFLLFSVQTYAASDQTFVGKLATNVQESDGTTSPFSLITEMGGIKLRVEEDQFVRALHKLSGRILVVAGELKETTFDGDVDLDTTITSDMIAGRVAIPVSPLSIDLTEDTLSPFDNIDLDESAELNVSQYTVLVKEVVMEGTIRSEWAEGDENYFLKIASGEDKKLTLLQDDQNDFFEKYHEKEVKIIGSKAMINNKTQFVVSEITLK